MFHIQEPRGTEILLSLTMVETDATEEIPDTTPAKGGTMNPTAPESCTTSISTIINTIGIIRTTRSTTASG